MLDIEKIIEENDLTVALEGQLDSDSAPALEAALMESLPETGNLTLNMEKLDYISSAGLRVLLRMQKLLPEEGRFKLEKVAPAIMDILDVTGFADILNIV